MIQRFTRSQTAIRRGLLLLALVPPLVTLAYILRYGIDVPYMDQWNSVLPQVLHWSDGNLRWEVLWVQHNEFRPLAPRLLWLPLAGLTDWNIRAELILNSLVALGSFGLLVWHARPWKHAPSPMGAASILAVSILHFSIIQWENWLNGFQLVIFLNIFAALCGLSLLVLPAGRLPFLAAMLMGAVSAYSTTNGLLFWLAGAAVLAIQIALRSGYRPAHLLAWLGTSILLVGGYYRGFVTPTAHPSPADALRQPLEFLRYLSVIIGRGVGANAVLSVLASVLLLLFLGMLMATSLPRGLWRRLVSDRDRLFFLGAMLFALLSLLAIAAGRTGFGWQQALSPRYATMSSLLWTATILLTGSWSHTLRREYPTLGRTVPAWLRPALLGLLLFASVGSLHASRLWWPASIGWRHTEVCRATRALLDGSATDEMLEHLHPEPEIVRQRSAELAARGLSLYREPARPTCGP